MNNVMRLGTGVILVVAGVIIGLVASRSTRATYSQSQESALPSVFTVGATIQLDFGSPLWHIDEIRGQWLRVTDASSEPQYTGVFWINGTTGRIWGVKQQPDASAPTVPPRE